MKNNIKERVLKESYYIVKTNETIREIARKYNVSKSTVHKDMQERLYLINKNKYYKVRKIMDEHMQTRHIKGGESTRKLFLKKKIVSL